MSYPTRRNYDHDLVDELFRGFFLRPVGIGKSPQESRIKVDVKENAEAYQLHAELAGVKKEDIHVDISGNTVTIEAECKHHQETREEERFLCSERYFGKLSRSLTLAEEIEENQAVAKFNDGVLDLTLPKRRTSTSKRLAIE